MKKFLWLSLLLSCALSVSAQMKAYYGVYQNIPYVFWDGPGKDLVVIAQGSGEFATSFNVSALPNAAINSVGYAAQAKNGAVFEFDILVAQSYRAPGVNGNPTQLYLMHDLANLIKQFKPDKVLGTGYSFGGQLMAGFYTDSQNGTKPTDYIGGDIFDGYIIMAGKAPGSPNWCAHASKPVLIVHGSNDTAVPISNGLNIMNKINGSGCSTYTVFPNYKQTWKGSVMSYVPCSIPDTELSRMYIIIGGSHGSSWNQGYNLKDPVGAEVYKFIKKVCEKPAPPPINCPAELDTVAWIAKFVVGSDTLIYKIQK